MLGRDRHRVGGVDQLRHKGTVGAKRNREAPARAGRPVVADGLEQALVVSDRLAPTASFMAPPHASRRRRSPAWSPRRIEARPTASASPARSNAPITRGSPPASPQRLTSRPDSRPCCATDAISRMTPQDSGVGQIGDRANIAAGGGDVLGEIVGADREEIGVEKVDRRLRRPAPRS